jgi:hypothetical protein
LVPPVPFAGSFEEDAADPALRKTALAKGGDYTL